MSAPDSAREGPFVGSRCLAGPGGRWNDATIRRLNEDGTVNIEFDVKELIIMPIWYGVTLEEISFDDAQAWPAFFSRLSPQGTLHRQEFAAALHRLGYPSSADELEPYWDRACQEAFDDEAQAAHQRVLDAASSYPFFRAFGLSTKECSNRLDAGRPHEHFKAYWNQTRMGGRNPAELPRAITLDDCFSALGLRADQRDPAAETFFVEFERRENVRLPAAVKRLLGRRRAAEAIKDSHPNNPDVEPFASRHWICQRGCRSRGAPGEIAILIFVHYDFEWCAVFDEGDDDARVCLAPPTEDSDVWLLVSPSVPLFFWDLAQTGLGWYQATGHSGGRPVVRTDVGLVRAAAESSETATSGTETGRASFFRSAKEFFKSILRRFGRSA